MVVESAAVDVSEVERGACVVSSPLPFQAVKRTTIAVIVRISAIILRNRYASFDFYITFQIIIQPRSMIVK